MSTDTVGESVATPSPQFLSQPGILEQAVTRDGASVGNSFEDVLRQLKEQEADAKAELMAVKDLYSALRSETEQHELDMAVLQAHNSDLVTDNERLSKQLEALKSQTIREVKAVEADKMRLRLEKMEHAVEQERNKNRRLEDQLKSAQHMTAEAAEALQLMPKMKDDLIAMQKRLEEAELAVQSSAAMKAQLSELIQAGYEQLEDSKRQEAELLAVKQENKYLRSEVHRLREGEASLHLCVRAAEDKFHAADAVALDIRRQNQSVCAANEKLVVMNDELVQQVNQQATTIVQLKSQLEAAQRLVEAMSVEPPRAGMPQASSSEISEEEPAGVSSPPAASASPLHLRKLKLLSDQLQRLEVKLHKQRDMNVVLRTQLLKSGVKTAVESTKQVASSKKETVALSFWQYIAGADRVKEPSISQ